MSDLDSDKDEGLSEAEFCHVLAVARAKAARLQRLLKQAAMADGETGMTHGITRMPSPRKPNNP